MATFFSGTDTATLREEGNDRNHFVSLIVNNEGTYTAAITRKVLSFDTIISNYSYKSFGDIVKTGKLSHEITNEVIEYNLLTVIKEGEVENSFLEINERLNTIKEAKANKVPKIPWNNFKVKEDSKITSPTLFDSNELFPKQEKEISLDPNDNYISDEDIKTVVLQLITGSIIISDTSKIDPIKWAPKMVGLFNNRFKDDASFESWAWTMIDFIVTNSVPPEYEQCSDAYITDLCSEVYDALNELPQNKYIKIIQNTLLLWMN